MMSPKDKKVSVLVVDDSTFMRKALKRMLCSDPMIRVVGDAKDGIEAIEKVGHLKPDVVTLDVKMPGMDGLETLQRIMEENPTPVLMVSALTNEGGSITLQALAAGAVDFIDKSSCHTIMDITNIADTLIKKVKVIAGVDIHKVVTKPAVAPSGPKPVAKQVVSDKIPSHIVAIGASTGGPMSLEKVLCALPGDYSGAIMLVQHMPEGFTSSFAERLNNICPMRVKEAEENDPVTPGGIYIAPGGYHLKLKRCEGESRVLLSKYPRDVMHIPSVDVMMKSIAETWPGGMMGIILTGMGSDGAEGIKAMKRQGGTIMAQNEQTCVVYGMPKAAYQSGYVDRMIPLNLVASEICHFKTR